jgi:hypothetical protein
MEKLNGGARSQTKGVVILKNIADTLAYPSAGEKVAGKNMGTWKNCTSAVRVWLQRNWSGYYALYS